MLPPTGLIPWFSKTEGNTYATVLHHPFLFKGKPTHAQEVVVACSSETSLELTSQQSFEREFRQHDGVMTVIRMLPMQGFA